MGKSQSRAADYLDKGRARKTRPVRVREGAHPEGATASTHGGRALESEERDFNKNVCPGAFLVPQPCKNHDVLFGGQMDGPCWCVCLRRTTVSQFSRCCKVSSQVPGENLDAGRRDAE